MIDYCIHAPAWVVAIPFVFMITVLIAVKMGWV